MYTIRIDQSRSLLLIELSERVDTAEAERVLEQALALAEASRIDSALCDVTRLVRGPAGLLALAASFSLRFVTGMRVAFVGGPYQAGVTRRFRRFTGHPEAVRYFDSETAAEAWLNPAARGAAEEPPRAGQIVPRQEPRRKGRPAA